MKTILIFLMLVTTAYAGMDFRMGSSPINAGDFYVQAEKLDRMISRIFVNRLNVIGSPNIRKELQMIREEGLKTLEDKPSLKEWWVRIFGMIEHDQLRGAADTLDFLQEAIITDGDSLEIMRVILRSINIARDGRLSEITKPIV